MGKTNTEKSNEIRNIGRGGIYYISIADAYGFEEGKDRPAVVLSNNQNNRSGRTVTVVYLTTKEKKRIPTHCTIYSTGRKSTVLCEQITTVDARRIGRCLGCCTKEEMNRIETCVKEHLQLIQ